MLESVLEFSPLPNKKKSSSTQQHRLVISSRSNLDIDVIVFLAIFRLLKSGILSSLFQQFPMENSMDFIPV
jgi:hypothetical protein